MFDNRNERGLSPVDKISFEAKNGVLSGVAKFYTEWRSQRYGNPGANIPENPDMPNWKKYADTQRNKIVNSILNEPETQKYTADPNFDVSDNQKRVRQVIEAIDFEIQTGVVQKYDNPEAARTAKGK